tara:strand:- start:1713 stop:2459 length:747 start_codon:yes stop_codon:yes gene_type:complete
MNKSKFKVDKIRKKLGQPTFDYIDTDVTMQRFGTIVDTKFVKLVSSDYIQDIRNELPFKGYINVFAFMVLYFSDKDKYSNWLDLYLSYVDGDYSFYSNDKYNQCCCGHLIYQLCTMRTHDNLYIMIGNHCIKKLGIEITPKEYNEFLKNHYTKRINSIKKKKFPYKNKKGLLFMPYITKYGDKKALEYHLKPELHKYTYNESKYKKFIRDLFVLVKEDFIKDKSIRKLIFNLNNFKEEADEMQITCMI